MIPAATFGHEPYCHRCAGVVSWRLCGSRRRPGELSCRGRAGTLHHHGRCGRCASCYIRTAGPRGWSLELQPAKITGTYGGRRSPKP